jgi:hypothetical protein
VTAVSILAHDENQILSWPGVHERRAGYIACQKLERRLPIISVKSSTVLSDIRSVTGDLNSEGRVKAAPPRGKTHVGELPTTTVQGHHFR